VLETLAGLGWHATFFMLGAQVRRFPEIARLVVDAGHEVAVHGTLHRNHLVRSPQGVRRDLRLAVREITEVTAASPRWFPAEVMSTLRHGGTVLLHDSDGTSRPGSWRSTVGAFPLLAAQLRIRDLEVRTLGDHLRRPC